MLGPSLRMKKKIEYPRPAPPPLGMYSHCSNHIGQFVICICLWKGNLHRQTKWPLQLKNRKKSLNDISLSTSGLEVIKLEYSLKLRIKRNNWLLADTEQPTVVLYFEFENELKFITSGAGQIQSNFTEMCIKLHSRSAPPY